MPASNTLSQRPIAEQMDLLKSKIVLLEGDSKAYYETAQYAMKKNREKIQNLRKQNKELHKKLSDSLSQDEHVINEAFRNKPIERAALKNKTGQDAVVIMDHKVCDTLKQLNAVKHQRVDREKQFERLQTQYDSMVKDHENAEATEKGESNDAMVMRYLENNHDKSVLKLHEASHINRIYQQIKSKLQAEALTFNNNLNNSEKEISECQRELHDLLSMQNDALLAKESAITELRNQEEVVYSERKKRDFELQQMKKEAEEKKLAHERIEKRIAQRGSVSHESMVQPAEKSGSEEHFKKITTYEEAFRRIKEATGVSDTGEVVVRFASQGETTAHLVELKKDGERKRSRLMEEKTSLQQEFEVMKYSGDSKLSSGQRALEEFEIHLLKEEERQSEAETRLQRASEVQVSVKAGVEHLSNKLQHLKAVKSHVPAIQIPATSDEYVLDQLSTCEEKLLKLLEELDGKDTADLMQRMISEEFKTKIESKLPSYNTRIELPHDQKDNVYDDEEDSGEDDGDVPTRNMVKKQSQGIIDSKTKRRTQRRKKRTK